MLKNKLLSSSGSEEKLYVDDVFSTWLYTAVGGNQTVVNGIDLASKGGLVWGKARSTTDPHFLYDSARSPSIALSTASIAATTSVSASDILFNADGFRIPGDGVTTGSGKTFTTWTFRKAPKFFDHGTFTTGSSTNRRITHSLGIAPGVIIAKAIDGAGGTWYVYHQSQGRGKFLQLEATAAATTLANSWGTSDPTTTDFGVDEFQLWAAGRSIVWYAFAHDTSTDGMIQCGGFTADGSGNATVNLGWEPQYVMLKASAITDGWSVLDSMRGWVSSNGTGTDKSLVPNTSAAESGVNGPVQPRATGFEAIGASASRTYIYLAIRRPNKPPTTGTQVFAPATRTGTGAAVTTTAAGFAPDLVITKKRSSSTLTGARFVDRMRGTTRWLDSTATTAETATANTVTGLDVMSGFVLGTDATTSAFNTSTHTYVDEYLKRYPGVFDVVCYTGTGVALTVPHGLGALPELMIVKTRNTAGGDWWVQSTSISASKALVLNAIIAATTASDIWSNTFPTNSVFYVGVNGGVNTLSSTYVAYLFATRAGISKVGSYTGNGSSQTINCGFTTGARFILIKRTDSTGDWYIWDTARGVISGNDPHLSLNTTAAEVTTNDSIDPDATGFIVNQVAATNINVNTATYIYLAIA